MEATVLGSGDATGVPAPLCDCQYCRDSDRRRQPAMLVETAETSVLLDAGGDIREQLATAGVRSVDAVFITHAHGDHAGGLPALAQSVKWAADHLDDVDELAPTDPDYDPGYPVYLTDTARSHLADEYYDLGQRLRLEPIEVPDSMTVGDLTVTPVPVTHHRPTFETLAFRVTTADATLVYAPDMRRWHDGPPSGSIDLLVCEGAAVLGQPVHGPADELRAAIDGVDADRVVLVNVNEHLQRAHTDTLAARAAEHGYELGTDFATFSLS